MEIKSYKDGDEHEILNLFRLAFSQEMPYDYWTWRFKHNPFSEDRFIQLMWDNEKLVGHYSLSPVELLINGLVHQTALSMTTMTHPAYGGKGIFTQLAEALYGVLQAKHYTMVWGFPNENSHYGFNKNLKWQDVATIPMLSLKAGDLKSSALTGAYEQPNTFTDDLASLLNQTEKSVSLHKTAAYLNWRYISIPTVNYKIITTEGGSAILVYKVIPSFSDPSKREVDIMDIQFKNDHETLKKLLAAVRHAEGDDIHQFNIWDSIFSKKQALLEKAGFKMASPITYLGFLNFDHQRTTVGDYKNWEVNFGLSDVF
jgi:GNAT superfamily N-acetyltransferase